MIALIVGNGEVDKSVLQHIPKNPFVICADGGIRHMELLGLEADILMGDMDSANDASITSDAIVYPVRKDFTDSEIAVNYALEKGYTEIYMIGFTGTRLDHTFSNLSLLKTISQNGAKGKIIDKNNVIIWAESENIITGKNGDIVSILPFGEDVSGISTEGLDYPLKNETLYFTKSRGVSNVMCGEVCKITIESGSALIIKSKD